MGRKHPFNPILGRLGQFNKFEDILPLFFLGPKFLAKVRDSRNAMESDKYK